MSKLLHTLQTDRRLLLVLTFGSGLCMALATAPLNWWGLAWVALVPLWTIVQTQPPKPQSPASPLSFLLPSPSSLPPLLWGLGYHGLALSWITGLHPLTWMGIPWLASVAITLFCWAFITLWGAVLVMLWAVGMRWTTHRCRSPLRVLIGVGLWCSLEWVWSLGSLYWTALSYTQSPGNLAILHLGQLSGPAMVTAAIVAVNGLVAEAWMATNRRQRTTQAGGAIVLLVSLHLVGLLLYNRPIVEQPDSALRVGIVQGNIPTRIKLATEGIRRATENYTAGYEALAAQGVDAVLTPEGALPVVWNQPQTVQSPVYQAVVKARVPLWLGTFTLEDNRLARSLLTIDGNGTTLSRYNKIKLVPLGEYIPFSEVLGRLVSILSTIDENGLPGTFHQQFDTPFGRAIASICYDSAFPEVFRLQAANGGQFILTASNLDPYSEVLMAQHQAQDLMRAIETDRWAVRATNTGYSGVIDPHGKIVWRSHPHQYERHADTIYRRQTQTLYVRWGDWLTPSLVGLGVLSLTARGLTHR